MEAILSSLSLYQIDKIETSNAAMAFVIILNLKLKFDKTNKFYRAGDEWKDLFFDF